MRDSLILISEQIKALLHIMIIVQIDKITGSPMEKKKHILFQRK